MEIPTLETERLTLRALRAEDFAPYHAMCSDAEVMEFIGQGKLCTPLESWRQIAAILGHWQLRGYGSWALEEKNSGRLVGRCGFINPETWPELEIGWALAREYWGRGYATEAAGAALEFGRSDFGFRRVISLIHAKNTRSAAVAQRLGAVWEKEIEFFDQPVQVYAYQLSSGVAGD